MKRSNKELCQLTFERYAIKSDLVKQIITDYNVTIREAYDTPSKWAKEVLGLSEQEITDLERMPLPKEGYGKMQLGIIAGYLIGLRQNGDEEG